MIDQARTSRAKCRTCKQKIDKDTLRFGVLDFSFSSSGSYRWHHLRCATDRMPYDVEAWIRAHPSELPVPVDELRAAMDPAAASEEDPGADLPGDQLPAALQAQLAKKAPKLSRWLDLDTLPRLRLDDGRGMSRHAQAHVLAACKAPPSRAKDVALVDAVLEMFGRSSFTELWVAVVERWADGGTMTDKWVLQQLDRCDDRIVEPVAQACAGWMRRGGTSNDKARRVLDELAKTDRDTALLGIQQLAQRFAYKGHANVARSSLGWAARQRGLSIDLLEDTLVPTGGLDADGTRTFDFGPRHFTLRFDEHLEPILHDQDGEHLKSLPRPRSADDDAKVEAAKRDWTQLKKTLSQLVKVQRARLEEAMVIGRRWTPSQWEKHLRHHPLMRHIAARCVWAEVGPEGIVGTFRIDEEGQLVDAEDESYAPPTHSIALLHPVEDPEAAGAWGEVFGDYEIVAAFDQLARPAHRTHVASFPVPEHADGPEMSPGHVQGVLSRHRWEKDYDYVVTSFHKRFGDRNVTATIHFHPGMQPRGCDTPQQVCGVSWRGTPDPVVLSEVLATVHALQA